MGKVSAWRHHFFIRYEIILYLINLNEISLFVKVSEKVVAPYGKLPNLCTTLLFLLFVKSLRLTFFQINFFLCAMILMELRLINFNCYITPFACKCKVRWLDYFWNLNKFKFSFNRDFPLRRKVLYPFKNKIRITFRMAPPLFHSFLQKGINQSGKLDTILFYFEWKSGGAIRKLFQLR